jgi:hypothetical protein
MFGIMFTPISSGTAAQLNTIHTVYALCDDNQNVHNLLPSDHLLCSVFTHFFFIQCPLLLKCWFFFSVLFLFTLLLKCWFLFSVLSSLGSLAQVIKLCSSFVYVCMLVFCFWSLSFFWVFVLVLLCSVLCLLVFWVCLVAYILFVSFTYLSFIHVFVLAFLFQICFEGGSFWSHYPSNKYDTTCSFGHTQYARNMYHTTSHFALIVFFSDTWSTCSHGHTILAIFYHTSIHFALKVFFSDILS